MVSDDFPSGYLRWKGVRYSCIQHARWALIFDQLKLDFDYMPRRMKFERPGNERYKQGSKTEYWYFDLHFYLYKQDIWLCVKRETGPSSQSYLDAQRTAQITGRHVVIIHGGPKLPTPHGFNWTTYVQGVEDEIPNVGLIDTGSKVIFAPPRHWSERFTERIQNAFVLAELLDPPVNLGQIPSEEPEANGKPEPTRGRRKLRKTRKAHLGGRTKMTERMLRKAVRDAREKHGASYVARTYLANGKDINKCLKEWSN